MSGTHGPGVPPEPRDEPPYPGWSPEQPSARPSVNGWTAPGSSDWDSAGGAGASADTGASGTGAAPKPGQRGWQSTTEATWGIPDVKPGVIPLRPLGVGEILDGAVTTIRRNPAAMLGLSAIVAVVTQALGLAANWALFGDLASMGNLSPTAAPAQILDALSGSIATTMVTFIVTGLATVFLTGVLTTVVGRAALGEDITARRAWQTARGRLLKLLGLTILYFIIWFSPLVAGAIIALVVGLTTSNAGLAAAVFGVFGFAALAVMPWLYVRFSLSGPALMLESADGGRRPIRVMEALRRSSALVERSWWRVFGILLLLFIIVWLITNVIAVPFGLPLLLDSGDPAVAGSFGTLAISAFGTTIAATITAPFSAAVTALLYIDRRIRREGLDIELARAAGVELPARPDRPGGQPPGAR